MKKKEYKIGETFQFGLKTLKCVEAVEGCYGCALRDIECIDLDTFIGTCTSIGRSDNEQVIFIEVKETDK